MTREVRLMLAAVVVLATVIVGQQVYIHTRPEPVAWLDFPQQRVLSAVQGVRGPAVLVGDDLVVEGVKCNNGPADLGVSGAVSWMSVAPSGTIIPTGQGHAVRKRGCQAFRFVNPIPDAVASRARELTAQLGAPCTTWQITGREVPDDPLVLAETWSTEPFQLCTTVPA